MIRSKFSISLGIVCIFVWSPAFSIRPVGAAPPPKERLVLPLAQTGELKVRDLSVEAAAVIDESTVVLVGTKANPDGDEPDTLDPNGAIVDLSARKSRPFTNGHTARICDVAVNRGRVATVSTNRDPVLRIWDRKADKSVAAVEIEKPGDTAAHYAVSWFHKGERVAVVADPRVWVFDPGKSDDRTELACPPAARRWLSGPVAISPDDKRVYCTTVRGGELLGWELATKKATVSSILPTGYDGDGSGWTIGAVQFGPKGELFACRSFAPEDEVREKIAEKDVPADRRGTVRVDTASGKVTPLGMGLTIYTMTCAVDPTGTWLVTGGTGRLDPPIHDTKTGGEFRVYHLPTGELAYREQPKGSLPLKWVSFTPSGKRIVSATYDGVIQWWDLPE
jgi:WD40 repeat protein